MSARVGLSNLICIVLWCCSMKNTVSFAAGSPKTRNIVVVGGGIQGTSVAYHLARHHASSPPSSAAPYNLKITILEAKAPASAASGKGGGFMARSWGDGSPTQRLHELGFDMYEGLATELGCTSYRRLPVLSVTPGYRGIGQARKDGRLGKILPSWLDGDVGRISAMGFGDDTAQITPSEFVEKMLEATAGRVSVVLGTCTGVETDQGSERGSRKVTGVRYTARPESGDGSDLPYEELTLPADAVVVSAGPWSCAAEDWFQGAVQLPMEGIKSTSIVWKQPQEIESVDATALFCGEDDRFQTHLECYPRPDGSIYLCGIGGSDYITKEQLKEGAFLEVCEAKESRVTAAMQAFQEMSSLYKKFGELDRTQACMRPCPPDALPYMGAVPSFEGAFINAGHNCWGIAWAPASGRVMAELILDGEAKSVNLDPFDPARFTEQAEGGRGRKRRGINVGEQW